MTRSEQRQLILSLAYEKVFHFESTSDFLETALNLRDIEPERFVTRCVEGIFANIDQIDDLIQKNCIGWKINRIAIVPLSILRLAVYEMLFEKDIPVPVTINEAVELAKTYAGDDDPSFINGILGSIAKVIEK